jgi:hypothetical protein
MQEKRSDIGMRRIIVVTGAGGDPELCTRLDC